MSVEEEQPQENHQEQLQLSFTKLDNNAQRNHQDIFQIRKRLYASQIQQFTEINKNSNENFVIKHLYIGFMESMVLRDHPKFKEIKRILNQYNAQVPLYNQKAVDGLHLKTVVMESMIKFMRLMMLAPDASTKKRILEISYDWFIAKITLQARAPKNAKKLQEEIRSIVRAEKLLSEDQLEKSLPSYIKKNQLKDYKAKFRTTYNQLDPPKQQLQNYHTHNMAIQQKPLQTQKQIKQSKSWMKRLVFNNKFTSGIPQKEQQQSKNPTIVIDNNIQPILPIENNDNILVISENNLVEEPQNNFGIGQNVDEDDELDEPEQQVKKGKLDPLVKVFMLQRIRQKAKSQYKADKRLQHTTNHNFITLKQDQEALFHLNKWATTKARIKTQSSRKINNRNSIKTLHTLQPKEQTTFERTMRMLKVNQVIKSGKKEISDINRQSLNSEKGLSIFDKRRVKTQHKSDFSEILSTNSRLLTKNDMLSEIEDIKSKFSSYKMHAPVGKLVGGLMHPQQIQPTRASSRLDLPIPTLFSNPFMKIAKKKKKKKKI